MIFKENDTQIEINKVEVPFEIMRQTIIDNGVHLIPLQKNTMNGTELEKLSVLATDDKDYCSDKDMRRTYSGKTYLINGISFKHDENGKPTEVVVDNSENARIFILISKRDIKEQFPELKRGLSVDTERWGNAVIERVLQYINSWLNGNTYFVRVTVYDCVQNLCPIFADDTFQMKESLFLNVIPSANDDLFNLIEKITI